MSEAEAEAGAVRGRLVRLVAQLLEAPPAPAQSFPVHQQLSELGLTSLKMVNLMLAVEVEFDIAIPPSDITPENFHTVASMEALVGRLCGSG